MNSTAPVSLPPTPLTRESVLAMLAAQRDKLREFGVVRLAIFGSVVRNEARADSDLDVLVEFEKSTFDTYMGLKFFLEDLFGRSIDLTSFRLLKPRLKDRILREALHVEGF